MARQYAFLTPVRRIFNGILLALCFAPSFSLALPLEYTASYDIEKYGMVVAESKYSLKHENGGVRLTQHTEPVGLVSIFRSDTLDENSFLSIQHNQLLLTEFSYKLKSSSKKNRDVQLKIDWIQSEDKLLGNVTGTAKGKELNIQVNTPVWDTSSYQIPLMLNAQEKALPQECTMMVKGQFRTYSFITHGPEEMEINGITIQTIKLERDGRANNNPIYIWLAPGLNNLPAKIEKWKDGDLQLSLVLNKANFPANKTMKFNADEDFDELIDIKKIKGSLHELEEL